MLNRHPGTSLNRWILVHKNMTCSKWSSLYSVENIIFFTGNKIISWRERVSPKQACGLTTKIGTILSEPHRRAKCCWWGFQSQNSCPAQLTKPCLVRDLEWWLHLWCNHFEKSASWRKHSTRSESFSCLWVLRKRKDSVSKIGVQVARKNRNDSVSANSGKVLLLRL